MSKIVTWFKTPSQKGMHDTVDALIDFIVFMLLATLLVFLGNTFHWNPTGVYVFSVYASWVMKVYGGICAVFTILLVVRFPFYRKNMIFIGNLGRVMIEHKKWKKVAAIHLDKTTGLKELKQLNKYKATKYFIREFVNILETIQIDDRFRDVVLVEGVSSKIDPKMFESFGIETKRYKSASSTLTTIIFKVINHPFKLSSYKPEKEYSFLIPKSRIKDLDMNRIKRMGKEK